MILLEICVADAQSLDAAITGGAGRIELCSALELGGLSPGPGLLARARSAPIPVHVMVRPRSGDFCLTPTDLETMLAEITQIRAMGFPGIVLGANRADSTLDTDALKALLAAATGLSTTLHRAFDLTPDKPKALETAIALGFDRILTSGGAPTATVGLGALKTLVHQAAGRIGILPGSGITADTIDALLPALPVTEIHASCALPQTQSAAAAAFGFTATTRPLTSADSVRALRNRLDAIAATP